MDQEFPSLDLGNQVSRDITKRIGFGTYSEIYEGILAPEKTKVAVKVVRCDSRVTLPLLMVGGRFILFSVMSHCNVSEVSQRSAYLVQA